MNTKNPLTLSVSQISEISNFAHWIPITRSYHHDFLEKNYPGWDWNDLLPVLLEADLVAPHIDGHECKRLRLGLCITPSITSIELTLIDGVSRVTGVNLKR
jgi:hypothetical protein